MKVGDRVFVWGCEKDGLCRRATVTSVSDSDELPCSKAIWDGDLNERPSATGRMTPDQLIASYSLRAQQKGHPLFLMSLAALVAKEDLCRST